MSIEHGDAINVFEEHFRALEMQPLDAKIKERQLFAKPLTCRQWHELMGCKGMDYNIRLIQFGVVYEDGQPVLKPADIYRLEDRVDGAVITAIANMAYEKIVKGVESLKKGLGRPETSS